MYGYLWVLKTDLKCTSECTYEFVDGYSDIREYILGLWMGIATLECTFEFVDGYSDIREYI